MTASYRVRQFIQAASAWLQPALGIGPAAQVQAADRTGGFAAESSEARRYLPAEALKLYEAMPRYDRRHGLAVMQTLQAEGHTDPALMAAALLHDAGKSAVVGGRLTLWHRALVVLMNALSPNLVGQIGQDQPGSWRWPFFVQMHHAEIGAELAQYAGCSGCTAELIRSHEAPRGQTDGALLAALQRADDLN